MSKSRPIPEEPFSGDDRAERNLPDQSVDSTSSVDSSLQIIKNPRQELSQLIINKVQNSNDPLEIEKLVNLAVNLASNNLEDLDIEKSEDARVLKKALSTTDPSVREQLLDFYPILLTKKEELRQNKFIRTMTATFLGTGIAIGTAGVVLEIPIVLGAGGILLGASIFGIVPDYMSKVIDRLNVPGVFPKIKSSRGDDTLATEYTDKNEDN